MNVDKQEIKALAQACDPAKCADEAEEGRRLAEFYSELTPEAVLDLLAEIDRLETQVRLAGVAAEVTVHKEVGRAVTRELALAHERDQLKAENEALRTGQAINRLSCAEVREAYNGAYYQPRDIGSDGEQCRAGVLAVIEVATAKEASHG